MSHTFTLFKIINSNIVQLRFIIEEKITPHSAFTQITIPMSYLSIKLLGHLLSVGQCDQREHLQY